MCCFEDGRKTWIWWIQCKTFSHPVGVRRNGRIYQCKFYVNYRKSLSTSEWVLSLVRVVNFIERFVIISTVFRFLRLWAVKKT
ncbi:hypothetical protein KC19_9G023800 [Ceratodon purpureus]|uniref:Uncharacterized protein n=1 Tax=Ceratodon purpureus TaxID=3225 RepID=A0A8T0GPH2_CERPU|nr:hypothetical protein KC19_9G023800 [Ceratodon purpureus]